MSMGITKLRKGSKGTVILGCETEQKMEKLKTTVQTKLGENFKVTVIANKTEDKNCQYY